VPLIRPFAGLRPAAEYAALVAAPPYDVLSDEKARARAEGNPWSFLHISKPVIDLPRGADPNAPQAYLRAAENLRHMLERGVLRRDNRPCYYVYRMVMNDHVQTGLVAAASLAEYDAGRIRRHELTRPDKVEDRVRQIDALGAQTGPALLVFRADPQVDKLISDASSARPACEITASNGVLHTLWVLCEQAAIERLTEMFDAMPALYIADGHHRIAAASRVAAARRTAAKARHVGEEDYEGVLAVAFPENQMRILPYHRVVRDLNGLTVAEMLRRIEENFSVRASPAAVAPEHPGVFGMRLPGQWYRLEVNAASIRASDAVAKLDVNLLAERLLKPVLGIAEEHADERIDFVGGVRGMNELERRVDSGEMAAAFAVHPTRMKDLMAVADSGRVMPPKSTWFEPKLADGLVSLVLD
jgi:uncharacterized protein (DUF1015 family)